MAGLMLTGLDDVFAATQGGAEGKPLMIPIDEIEPDPDQPRNTQKLNQERFDELVKSIKQKGVKSPISVKPKGENGKYRINHGERRWLASKAAGKTEIPAFVDAEHDSADQMIENIQRDDLTPLEIGDWIVKRLATGQKQVEIAEELGKDKAWVSRHVKIAQGPKEIRAAAEKCADYMALVELVNVFEQFPAQAGEFIQAQEQIARKDVLALLARCKNPSLSVVENGSAPGNSSPPVNGTGAQSAGDAKTPANGGSAAGDQGGAGSQAQHPSATEKESGRDKAAGNDANKSGDKAGKANAAPPSILAAIYAAQVEQKKDIKTVLEDLDDEAMLKAFRLLAKDHKKGRAVKAEGLPLALAQGLASGAFSPAGEGLYSMLAFIDGAVNQKDEFTSDRMKEKCFTVVEQLAQSS